MSCGLIRLCYQFHFNKMSPNTSIQLNCDTNCCYFNSQLTLCIWIIWKRMRWCVRNELTDCVSGWLTVAPYNVHCTCLSMIAHINYLIVWNGVSLQDNYIISCMTKVKTRDAATIHRPHIMISLRKFSAAMRSTKCWLNVHSFSPHKKLHIYFVSAMSIRAVEPSI